jgi:hypothetical protein
VLGSLQPEGDRREEPLVERPLRRVEPRRQRRHRVLVDLEEQTRLRAEVLEDRALRDRELRRDVFDPSALIPVLGEMPHRASDDALSLREGASGPRW